MSDWLGNMHFSWKLGLGAYVDLKLEILPAPKPVEVVFLGVWAVPEATEADALQTIARLPELEAEVAEAAFRHYHKSPAYHMSEAWIRLHGQPLDVPLVDTSAALKPYYQLRAMYFPQEPESGRFGLGFTCAWEDEAGLGVQFRNWQIKRVSHYRAAWALQ